MSQRKKNKVIKKILLICITIICIIFIIGTGNAIRLNIIEWWTYSKESIISMVIGKTWICIKIAGLLIAELIWILLPFCLPWENKKKRRDKKDGKH